MSVGLDYVSELWPPTGLLFIPYVIYERGEPWWNDIDKEKLLIHAPELSGNPTRRVIWYQVGGTDKENYELDLQNVSFIFEVIFMCRKILRYAASDFTSPPKEGVLWIFITFKIPLHWLGLNP
jgi:hypothetical protein